MKELIIAFGLFLFIEGILYALFPSKMKSMLQKLNEVNNNQLRTGGFVFAIIGFITTGLLGRMFSTFFEKILSKMPVLRNIYSGLKQLFETILSQKSNSFREVVLIEYPREGIWAMGFLTGDTKGEVNRKTKNQMVNIFLPTTPNPTSGFLLFVPKKDIIRLSMTVEEGIKMIISAGMLTPSENQNKIKSLKKIK